MGSFGKEAQADRFEIGRDLFVGSLSMRRDRRLGTHPVEEFLEGASIEGKGISEPLVEKHAEGVLIGRKGERLFREEFGSDVEGCTFEEVIDRALIGGVGGSRHALCGPPVDEVGAAILGEEDVGGFDIEVDEAFLMHVMKGFAEGLKELFALREGEGAFLEELFEGLAFDPLHGVKGPSIAQATEMICAR